jgi:hypothetical protein
LVCADHGVSLGNGVERYTSRPLTAHSHAQFQLKINTDHNASRAAGQSVGQVFPGTK